MGGRDAGIRTQFCSGGLLLSCGRQLLILHRVAAVARCPERSPNMARGPDG